MIDKGKLKKKKKTTLNSRGSLLLLFFLFLAGIGVIIGLCLKNNSGKSPIGAEKLAEGRQYIQNLEGKSIADIEAEIKAEKRREQLEAFESQDYNVWAYFGNIVMMGDSRTKEFSHSEFVESRRVLAEDGDTLMKVNSYLDALTDLNPDFVILQYGINDMENPEVWPSVQAYVEDMDAKISSIKESVPGVVVFVQSILPCVDPELSRLECRQEIPAWNEAIREHCEERGIPFIDVTDIAETHAEYYEPDGMHFTSLFYEYWARRLVAEVLSYEA